MAQQQASLQCLLLSAYFAEKVSENVQSSFSCVRFVLQEVVLRPDALRERSLVPQDPLWVRAAETRTRRQIKQIRNGKVDSLFSFCLTIEFIELVYFTTQQRHFEHLNFVWLPKMTANTELIRSTRAKNLDPYERTNTIDAC